MQFQKLMQTFLLKTSLSSPITLVIFQSKTKIHKNSFFLFLNFTQLLTLTAFTEKNWKYHRKNWINFIGKTLKSQRKICKFSFFVRFNFFFALIRKFEMRYRPLLVFNFDLKVNCEQSKICVDENVGGWGLVHSEYFRKLTFVGVFYDKIRSLRGSRCHWR